MGANRSFFTKKAKIREFRFLRKRIGPSSLRRQR